MIILKNTFHKTSVNTRLKEGKNIVTRRTFSRWMRELCSDPDCACDAMIVAIVEGKDQSFSATMWPGEDANVTIGEPIY